MILRKNFGKCSVESICTTSFSQRSDLPLLWPRSELWLEKFFTSMNSASNFRLSNLKGFFNEKKKKKTSSVKDAGKLI